MMLPPHFENECAQPYAAVPALLRPQLGGLAFTRILSAVSLFSASV
jgi:hypothetical protein